MADVVPEANAEVWGAVFEIDDRDIGSLDASESFSPRRAQNSYTSVERDVFSEGNRENPLTASVYIAHKESNPPLPNAAYKGLIVEGAKFWHLPAHYIAELEQIEIEGTVRGGSTG